MLSNGRPAPHLDERVDRSHAVVQAGVGLERDAHVVLRRAIAPQHVVAKVQVEHAVRADKADLDGMPSSAPPEVARRTAHRADRAVRVADRDRVMQLHLGIEWRGHEREHVLPAQPGQPQRNAEQMSQLGLPVPVLRFSWA